ncbi:Bark storage protein A [Camellia lanceoleosa]|uniref:Bark storage protein A n=1 Tax=Camellia lanceoleosa TaxID=1840588 RepID=A0ACC0IWX9_9ERIC|nr:Bark storage protein A [Camellia lanceoleosa]
MATAKKGRRFRVRKVHGNSVIYVRCGIGLVNAAAAAAAQQMLDVFKITRVVHFGIVGNASNSMSIGDVTIPKQFVNTGLWNWLLGHMGYSTEQFFLESGKPNNPQSLLWAEINPCMRGECLLKKPKLVLGLKGSTANTCVDNAAYRTSLSNGFSVIVIRGLSDLAGATDQNLIVVFGPLAALNVAKAEIQFVKILPGHVSQM